MADLESIATMLGGGAGMAFTAYQAFRSRREAAGAWTAARGARESAELAADRSEPTSNGFARSTTEALARIESQTMRNSQLLTDHIADHARAHIQGDHR